MESIKMVIKQAVVHAIKRICEGTKICFDMGNISPTGKTRVWSSVIDTSHVLHNRHYKHIHTGASMRTIMYNNNAIYVH